MPPNRSSSALAISAGPLLSLTACLACVACIGCASSPGARPEPAATPSAMLQQLPEPAALSLLDRLLLEQRQRPVEGWRVRLPAGGTAPALRSGASARPDFVVDLRLGDTSFGVEWVSREDRAALGSTLPEPDPSGQLRVLRGEAASEPALILLLDDRSYLIAQRDPSAATRANARSKTACDAICATSSTTHAVSTRCRVVGRRGRSSR